MKARVITLSLLMVLLVSGGTFGQGGDIDHQVAISVELAKKYDLTAVNSLCKQNGPSVLPHFQRYIADDNIYTRLAVETAAANFRSPEAEAILLQLIRDNKGGETAVANHALEDFIRLFPINELSESEAENLNDGLLLRAKRGDTSGLSLLLLAYHSQSPATVALLNRLREQTSAKVDMINALPADKSIPADVTLAQLDDKPANERLLALLHGGPVASIVDVIAAIPYINDPRLLLAVTDLLKDERSTGRVRGGMGMGGPGTPVPEVVYQRVCDLALIGFAKRDPSAIHVDVSKGNQRPFTQNELNGSYNALHIRYSSVIGVNDAEVFSAYRTDDVLIRAISGAVKRLSASPSVYGGHL